MLGLSPQEWNRLKLLQREYNRRKLVELNLLHECNFKAHNDKATATSPVRKPYCIVTYEDEE